jgi:hypothetical protein
MRRRASLTVIAIGMVAIASSLAIGSVATASSSKTRASKDVLIGFRMPSNNIFCMYVSSTKPRTKYLRCDIESGLKPKPPKKKGKECSYGITVEMNARGKSHYGCVSDSVYDPKAKMLAYGKTWRKSGFTCKSSEAGLTCTNVSRHGFFLSRQHSYLF